MIFIWNYEYIFLGANIDSVNEASKFGISEDFAVDYKCDSEGMFCVKSNRSFSPWPSLHLNTLLLFPIGYN